MDVVSSEPAFKLVLGLGRVNTLVEINKPLDLNKITSVETADFERAVSREDSGVNLGSLDKLATTHSVDSFQASGKPKGDRVTSMFPQTVVNNLT